MKQSLKLLAVILTLFCTVNVQAQGLLDQLNQEAPKTRDYTQATFKGLRVVSGQSIETVGKNNLVFLISHRFGRVSGSYQQFFGLDQAYMRLGLEYGVLRNLTVGVGRSTMQKTIDGFIKYRPISQQKGKYNIPLSVALFTSMAINTTPFTDLTRTNYNSSRLNYTFQILIARKFHEYFSLQLMPTLVHRNLVLTTRDKNDVFAVGAGARIKLTRSITLNGEYYYIIPGQIVSSVNGEKVRNSLQIGVDIETGGHVFQLHFCNTQGMVEKQFITEATGNWLKGEIQLGFNISRNFDFNHGAAKHTSKKKKEDKA